MTEKLQGMIVLGVLVGIFSGLYSQEALGETISVSESIACEGEQLGQQCYLFDYTNGVVFAQEILSQGELGAPVVLSNEELETESPEYDQMLFASSGRPRGSAQGGAGEAGDCRTTGCPKGQICSKTSLLGNRYSCYKPQPSPYPGSIGGISPLVPNAPTPGPIIPR